MKRLSARLIVRSLSRFNAPMICFGLFLLPASAHAEFQLPGTISARSVSGQFVVIGARQVSPLGGQPAVRTNANFVRIEPALLAVSAERVKASLWRELGVTGPWRGQIFLAVHPAQSLDENVTVVSSRFDNVWNCHVALPDVVSRTRLARALTGAVLLELANRNAGERSAEIPAWLVDGLSQQLLTGNLAGVILSAPAKTQDGILESRLVAVERGVDPLAAARRELQERTALTFDQLSWPTGAELAGGDHGVYLASAQLFVSELLKRKNGAAHLRAMLAALPKFYNWQTAFRDAFRPEFPRPLDVEKWWALRVVSFASRDAGPQWTPAVSRERLDGILSVPVEFRSASNNLPSHAEISLQVVLRSFESARQAEILQTKCRDLELAQMRVAAPFAGLTAAYRQTLEDYLGERRVVTPPPRWVKHPPRPPLKAGLARTLKKLDALDAQRRTIEAAVKPAIAAE
jgi:hypothetical protein